MEPGMVIDKNSLLKSVVIGMGIVVALAVMVGIVAFAPSAKTLASAPTVGDAVRPSPPPPLSVVTTSTPEPDVATLDALTLAASNDLEVVRFRPQVQLRRDEPSPPAAQPDKLLPAARGDALDTSRRPRTAYTAPDVAGILSPMEWNVLLYEGFEERLSFEDWWLYDNSDDGYERTWGDTNYGYQYGSWSAWPAAEGADALDPWVTTWYTDNLNSWMVQGPFDFSTMADIFVGFGLYYDTEPEYDWMYFCASIDGYSYSCDYWSGYSGGWLDQAYWLTSYAGYSQVWLAWVFISDSSISDYYYGPYVDEIWVWGDTIGGTPVPTSTPDPSGQMILNGSFETGDLTYWDSYSPVDRLAADGEAPDADPLTRPQLAAEPEAEADGVQAVQAPSDVAEVGVTDLSAVDGAYSAYLWRPADGNDFLYQTMDVPAGVNNIVMDFWFAVTTYETTLGNDWFCVGMADANLEYLVADLGCIDAYYTTGYWQQVLYVLTADEVAAVAGKQVNLVFELYNRGQSGTGTAGWVDAVQIYATGDGAGASLDLNEPNDSPPDDVTALSCGQTITGVIGDAVSSYGDVDWFVLTGVPTDTLTLDIKADTQVPPSALDSVVSLWTSNFDLLTWNDDDGVSYDSYVTYTNAVAGSTFYVAVESYSGYGGSDSYYQMTADCAGAGGGPPTAGNPIEAGTPISWTLMLYLNAEDRNFETTLRGYLSGIEQFIGSKQNFLRVVALFDGPNNGDTWRYVVQPNGNYTDGVNRWHLGEVNMGAPSTLAGFANWAMDQYPAAHYYLAIDDHGHGAYGISWDHTNGDDALTPPELYSALKDVTRNGARKIDIFDYEACLMGMAEHAYDVRNWVDYVVFFEQISWGLSTYPHYFSDLTAADTPLTVGQRIVSRYHTQAVDAGYPHTISFVRTDRMPTVKQSVTNLGNALVATGNITSVRTARNTAQAFAAANDATNPLVADYIDLWDLADKTAGLPGVATAAASVKTAVVNAVVAEQHSSGTIDGYYWNHTGVHGMSIYYPAYNATSAFNDYVAPRLFQMSHDESGIDGRWDEFLRWAVTIGGNGASDGLGGGDRKGMNSGRFLQVKMGGARFVYLPLVLRGM